jgi:DNA invertase Pin-like site-specific DNA recombinase
MRDCVRKGRIATGDRHGVSTHPSRFTGEHFRKLNRETIDEIRTRYSDGNVTMKTLGREYGLHWKTISNVINRKTWADAG